MTTTVSTRTRATGGLLMLLILTMGAPDAHAASVPSQALIRFQPGTPEPIRAATHARAGARVVKHLDVIDYDLVSLPDGVPMDAAMTSYRSDPIVAVAEPNATGRIALSPSDACHAEPCAGLSGQWHHRLTNTPFGWDALPGKTFSAAEVAARPTITIAVLDTHIDTNHPDFINAGGSSTDARQGGQLDLANARDWIPASRWTGSAAYHGTFVAGLAAAATGNGRGAAGVGYAARILPLTVVDGGGSTDAATLADAIIYAWQSGARIINLSLGITADSIAVHDAITVVTKGTSTKPASLVVAAAGNNTGSAAFYPGSYPEVMSVSGTDAMDRGATCSNYNGNVSVSAPADRLIGLTVGGGGIQAPCGTSAAAPQVSGLAAMLMMQDGTRTPAQIRSIIEAAADDLGAPGRDNNFGHGRINIERALRRGGATTTLARATVPTGGTTTITALASAPAGVRAAQVIFDRPDATPIALTAKDGAFGNATEMLTGTIAIPAGTTAGPHPIWVRSSDGNGFGATTVGVVIVDGRAPTISGASASNAVRVAGQPMVVSFSLTDDTAPTMTYAIEFRSQTTNAIIHRGLIKDSPAGAQRFTWGAGLEVPAGPYTIKIGAVDLAGNASTAEIGGLVS